jgi:hypothetical protein
VTPIAAGAMAVLRLGNRFPNVGACAVRGVLQVRVLRVARLRDVRARVMRRLVSDR